VSDSILGDTCPNDGREWNVQCARCGGECARVECENCDGGFTAPGDLHEMDPLNYDEDDVDPCGLCRSKGGWWVCANIPEWCEAHPLEDRASIRPGTLEWFTNEARKAS
jgi:hypothetical protein